MDQVQLIQKKLEISSLREPHKINESKTKELIGNDSLYSKVVDPDSLRPHELLRMYELMTEYYDNMAWQKFKNDLSKKDGVILLRTKKNNSIEGFSTFMYIDFQLENKPIRGIYSGDTVVNRLYWKQKVLGRAFLKHLFLMKLKSPFTPYYWFLISKGYKTYLLLANNFSTHFPRYEMETPKKFQKIMDACYSNLFGNNYRTETGLINGISNPCKLRQDITPITKNLISNNARIAYFSYANPNWNQGNELACIAKMTLLMPLKYQFKFLWQKIRKRR